MASLRKPIKDESGITLTVTPDLRLFNGGLGGVMSTSMKLPPGQATYMASAITKDGAVAAALKVRPNVLAFVLVFSACGKTLTTDHRPPATIPRSAFCFLRRTSPSRHGPGTAGI